jgi:hypothetical protein
MRMYVRHSTPGRLLLRHSEINQHLLFWVSRRGQLWTALKVAKQQNMVYGWHQNEAGMQAPLMLEEEEQRFKWCNTMHVLTIRCIVLNFQHMLYSNQFIVSGGQYNTSALYYRPMAPILLNTWCIRVVSAGQYTLFCFCVFYCQANAIPISCIGARNNMIHANTDACITLITAFGGVGAFW